MIAFPFRLGDHLEVDNKPPALVATLKVRVAVDNLAARNQIGELSLKLLASNGFVTLVHNHIGRNESINHIAPSPADNISGGVRPLNEEQDRNQESDPEANGRSALLKSRGRSLEITGLGIIVSLVVAFWSLVGDGTIQFSQYLVFLACMLISAAGMVWRILKLTPQNRAVPVERLQPGIYRVSFRGR